jgi:hypothetical protein
MVEIPYDYPVSPQNNWTTAEIHDALATYEIDRAPDVPETFHELVATVGDDEADHTPLALAIFQLFDSAEPQALAEILLELRGLPIVYSYLAVQWALQCPHPTVQVQALVDPVVRAWSLLHGAVLEEPVDGVEWPLAYSTVREEARSLQTAVDRHQFARLGV